MHLRPIALSLILCPAVAMAECPTGTDLDAGIAMRDSDGYAYVFRRQSDDVVVQQGTGPDGYQFRNLLGQGSHVLQLADWENGAIVTDSIINYSYPMPPAEMPVPAPGLTWQVQTTINSYGEFYTEAQSQVWGQPGSLIIGSCSYEVIPGQITYKSELDTIREQISFLPDLGIGLLVAYSDGSGYDDQFTFISIEAVK